MATFSGSCTSDWLEERIVNHLLRNVTFSPCPVWIALFKPPTTASGLEESKDYTEVLASGYQRVSASTTNISIDQTGFETPTTIETGFVPTPTRNWEIIGRTAYNNYQIDFPKALANWGEINYVAFMSGSHSSSGSRVYFYGALSGASSIDTSDTFSFLSGNLTLQLPGVYTYYSAKRMLDYILNRINFPSPGLGIYLALYNILPDDAGTSSSAIAGREVSGSVGYTRQFVAGTNMGFPGAGDGKGWTPPISGSTANSGSLVFTTSTSVAWGEIDGMALVYATSEDPYVTPIGVIYKQAFNPAPTINIGDGMVIPPGFLKVIHY